MVEKRYAVAFAEVLWYLNGVKKNDYNKIPTKFIKFLKEHASDEFDKFDYTKTLEELKLKDESIAVIDMICLNYWCDTEDEKNKFISILKNNSQKYQDELKNIYDINVFDNKHINIEDCNEKVEDDLIEYKESLLDKIIRKIKEFLKLFKNR